jgi:hypothetical protein
MAFAKLKALLRAAARTIPDLWQTIADALRRFTPLTVDFGLDWVGLRERFDEG